VQEKISQLLKFTKGCSLLYVEDNEDARKSTLNLLERFFDDISVAVDGEDGYQKYMNSDIDLIISDINMPKLSGIEMVSKIRQNGDNVSVIVLSAYNEIEYYNEADSLGVSSYLTKPLKLPLFVDALLEIFLT
jgi:YesN/AraC family two-component response regulator